MVEGIENVCSGAILPAHFAERGGAGRAPAPELPPGRRQERPLPVVSIVAVTNFQIDRFHIVSTMG